MKRNSITRVCIQANPNSLGIDFGGIELTRTVIKEIRRLYSILKKYDLSSIPTKAIPIKWYAAGQLQTGRHWTPLELCDGGSENCFTFFVEGCFYGAPSEDGMFYDTVAIEGHWSAHLEDLTRRRLIELADANGDIHAACDWGSTRLQSSSREAELKHAVLQTQTHTQTQLHETRSWDQLEGAATWPNPFDRWSVKDEHCSQSHRKLPANFIAPFRTRCASDVLALLFFVALQKHPNPNERCAIYTLAAAIIICPDEVELTQIVASDAPPIYNRSCELEPIGEWPLTDDYLGALGQICNYTGQHFERPNRKVRVRYKTLMGLLEVDRFNCDTTWATYTAHVPNLALLYEDHTNNEAAKYWLNHYQKRYTTDYSRLVLLSYGLDLVKRLFYDFELWQQHLEETLGDQSQSSVDFCKTELGLCKV